MHRELANWNMWFAAARLALKRHRQRRTHACLSLNQIASLLDIAFTLKRLACGLDSPQPATEPFWDNSQWEADLARSYGQARDSPAP